MEEGSVSSVCSSAATRPPPDPRASHPRRPISPRGWRKIRRTAKGERECCCIMEHERVGEGDATLDCLQKEQTVRIQFRRTPPKDNGGLKKSQTRTQSRTRSRASQPHFDVSENLLSPPFLSCVPTFFCLPQPLLPKSLLFSPLPSPLSLSC